MSEPQTLPDLLADLAWIREALGMLQDALGQSDLLPLLESELVRIGG